MSKSETYEEFVDKFKPKRTTDDCYTPPPVYNAVKEWAIKEMGWSGRPVVRPFYPGGDYENFEYPAGCVVIDNPPFSIVSTIANFYEERGIDYFLFCPHFTCFSSTAATSHICVGAQIIYENGAKVSTSFLCSQGTLIRSAPDLYRAVTEANALNLKGKKQPPHPLYKYPDNVMTASAVALMSKYGIEYRENTGVFVRTLDCQRKAKKSIFGAGYIVPVAAAHKAQEAVRKAKEVPREVRKKAVTRWELSPREIVLLEKAEAKAKAK